MWPAARRSSTCSPRTGPGTGGGTRHSPATGRPWPAGPSDRSPSWRVKSCWSGWPSSSTPVPSTTPRYRRSSRSPRPVRSSSPGSTRPSSGEPVTRRRRRSCSGRTACPSQRRSRSSTWRRGPGRNRSWPPPWSAATTPTRGRPSGTEWLDRLQEHLDRYGHTVYNLDFVNSVPADDPTPLIDTVRFYLRARTATRTRGSGHRRAPGTGNHRRARPAGPGAQEGGARGRCAGRSGWRRSARTRSAEVGLAWPQMRWMLAEIGDRLTGAGAGGAAGRRLLAAPRGADGRPRGRRGRRRATRSGWPRRSRNVKQEWRGRRRVTPPQLLPERRWGRLFDSMMPATTQEQADDVLTGMGASAGRVTATARVLGRPGRLRPAAGRRRTGGQHHHPGLDLAVRPGRRRGHRHRWPAQPQLHRCPGVRHPRGPRHRRRDPADHQRADRHGGRRRRAGDPHRVETDPGNRGSRPTRSAGLRGSPGCWGAGAVAGGWSSDWSCWRRR